jgi:hypothetical protein
VIARHQRSFTLTDGRVLKVSFECEYTPERIGRSNEDCWPAEFGENEITDIELDGASVEYDDLPRGLCAVVDSIIEG